MITGTSVALLMGASPQIAASILPKSVTTPIAMAVGGSIGGIPAISAMCVIFVGILGAVFGHTLLNAMRIRTKAARGWRWGPPRTPWAPHAALSWIIRKGRLAPGAGHLRDYHLPACPVHFPADSGGMG
jgi:hypothetical protein